MKIDILVDNENGDSLKKEWGLSILISEAISKDNDVKENNNEKENEESNEINNAIEHNNDVIDLNYEENRDRRILLDFGQSNKFMSNAKNMGIDLRDVNYAFLSHAHYDHSNGMKYFFKENNIAKLYLAYDSYKNKYYSTHKTLGIKHKHYVGIKKGYIEKYIDRLVFTKGLTNVYKNMYTLVHDTNKNNSLLKTKGMYVKSFNKDMNKYNKEFLYDNFTHEQSLIFDTPNGLVIFNSCSHNGVDKIIKDAKDNFNNKNIYAYIGGLHLFNRSDEDILKVCDIFKEENISYVITGHCTKRHAMDILKEQLGNKFIETKSGLHIEI